MRSISAASGCNVIAAPGSSRLSLHDAIVIENDKAPGIIYLLRAPAGSAKIVTSTGGREAWRVSLPLHLKALMRNMGLSCFAENLISYRRIRSLILRKRSEKLTEVDRHDQMAAC